jgi:hypothetical protein
MNIFHTIGRNEIKFDQLKIALKVVGHPSLLHPNIGIYIGAHIRNPTVIAKTIAASI